jgi:hypothetical protein
MNPFGVYMNSKGLLSVDISSSYISRYLLVDTYHSAKAAWISASDFPASLALAMN